MFSHQYLGTLFESFVVQLKESGDLTFQHQNISIKNAKEFANGLDKDDYKLIELMDSMQQDVVLKKFYNKKITPADFFLKVYNKEKGDKLLQDSINQYLEFRRSEILSLIGDKRLFVMGKDGEPAWKEVEVQKEKATVLFHFMKNDDNTHYFPTIKHKGEKVLFQYNESKLLCNEPAWLLVEDRKLFTFKKQVDGKKIKPFLNKKFIVIPKSVEEKYYSSFIPKLVANFDVYAKGFDINVTRPHAHPTIRISELQQAASADLFGNKNEEDSSKIVFELIFNYGKYQLQPNGDSSNSVKVEKVDGEYVFHKIMRDPDWEKERIEELMNIGVNFKMGKAALNKGVAFQWLREHEEKLKGTGYIIEQHEVGGKKYFLGKYSIDVKIKELKDWFDIHAIVKFGEFEIPFLTLKKYILSKKREFTLPNGEIAVIPDSWFTDYAELFAFSDELDESLKLQKHHVSLVQDLQEGNLAKVSMDKKLEALRDFENIEDYAMPANFKGTLRPYQKAGYNWMKFLQEYNLGGCLADDMGLGKTVQTLALLQDVKEQEQPNASLLVMPTSLVYNWEVEAKKFAPDLKILSYTGTTRKKDVSKFSDYDIILTSYGIVRLDVDLLAQYKFTYIILDESQAIKNPQSNIAGAVKSLSSKYRMILTGTPIENSTMDLWSQMSFVNPGLLSNQKYFKDEFLIPIEKKNDVEKKEKLYSLIKPFLLRRQKSQVVTELPDKIEQVRFCDMSKAQQKEYDDVKNFYRNEILDNIDKVGRNKSQFMILQGLSKLRQLANHPKMVDETYEKDSGKLDEIIEMLTTAIEKKHKVLIFSSFVKYLSIIRNHLDEEKIEYAYLDGSTKDRQAQVDLFQENDNIKVFLISLKAGGVGLNLTAADYVFILDPWWNPAVEAQAVDRAHRIGQKNQVYTYKFIAKNTVEEKILKLQDSKKKLASELITTEESFIKSLSNDDIKALLH